MNTMAAKIPNLTRKVVPQATYNAEKNMENLRSMPEMVLARMIREGKNSIKRVEMNSCDSVVIGKGGVNTIYTDGLNGCNSVGAVMRLKDGNQLFCLSHFFPTETKEQANAMLKELKTHEQDIDTNQTPRLFFNIRGFNNLGRLEAVCNPVVEEVKTAFRNFFKIEPKTTITPYLNKNRPAYFSSANIFQFNPKKPSELKITNVGEQENFINLLG